MSKLNQKISLEFEIEKFDDLFVGDPEEIERNLKALLPRAHASEDKSIYLQILSQIALAQAMQGKYTEAHETLDQAEGDLREHHELPRTRIFLERGRVYHQSNKLDKALPYFKKSYEISKKNKFDFHTINAAHMIAIAEKRVEDKIKWNKAAIKLAKKDHAKPPIYSWLTSLYNNLAQNYLEAKQYGDALIAFEECKKYAEEQSYELAIKNARWGIGRALRSLGRLEEALNIQLSLKQEYDEILKNQKYPLELIRVVRGVVYEELAEIYVIYARQFAALAYDDMSKDEWYKKLEPKRIGRMYELKEQL